MLIALLAAVGVILAALVCAANYLINFAIRKPTPLPPHDPATLSPFWLDFIEKNKAALAELDTLPHEQLTQTAHDGVTLHARFYAADRGETAHDTVIVVHGYRSGPSDFAMLLRRYRADGFNTLVLDNRAHGASEGKFTGFGALDARDCAGWCRIMAERNPDRAIFLHGISMGGATVCIAAGGALPPQVRGIISDCAYTSANEQFSHVMRTSMHIPGWVGAVLLPVASLFCRLRAGYFFGEASPIDALPRAAVPMLFIHGGRDDYVPTAMVHRLHDACPTAAGLLIVDEATHGVSYPVDPEAYGAALDAFFAGRRSDR